MPGAGYVGVRWLGIGGVICKLYMGVLLLAAMPDPAPPSGRAGMLPVAPDTSACWHSATG